jgi:hypothetical protein
MRRGSNEVEPLARNEEPELMLDGPLRLRSIVASTCNSSAVGCERSSALTC